MIVLDGTNGITSPNETITGSLNSINTFGFKNRIINGNMAIDQRNAGASVTPTSSGAYIVDRWQAIISLASKFSVQQNTGAVTPPSGFSNYLGATSLSVYSLGVSDYFALNQRIEGFNIADLGFGTANASTVTLSFWVRSSLTGTFGGSLGNSAGTRSYPFSYSIPVANTWTQIAITIAGDTTGTWLTNNGIGVGIAFGLGSGSTYSGTAGAWAAGNYVQPTGTVSIVGTSGATFYITGVQLEKGSVATSFDQRAYSQELAMCKRYYQLFIATTQEWVYNESNASTGKWWQFYISQTMRATPTISLTGMATGITINGLVGTVSSLSVFANTLNRCTVRITMSAAGGTAYNIQHCDGWVGNVITLSSEL